MKIIAKINPEFSVFSSNEKDNLDLLKEITQNNSSIEVKRYFTSLTPDQINELVEEAVKNSPDYAPPALFNYLEIYLPAEINQEEFTAHLLSNSFVESAYLAPKGINPAVNPGDDPKSKNQGYLEPAPLGIDAKYAWTVSGGDGARQRVIDLERGWTLDHQDLIAKRIKILHGEIDDDSRWHGTCVLGVFCATDNSIGCVGISPNVSSVGVVSYVNSTGEEKIADAILFAVKSLGRGDVLILEVQDNNEHPIEIWDAEFEAIRLATAAGIIVVEAAGNRGTNLDNLKNQSGRKVLNRNSKDFMDSGAIIVGAATSNPQHHRIDESNYGNRVDCFAWGENITTCISQSEDDKNSYTDDFNHTSGATPIVAGAAICIQGIAESKMNRRLSPNEMRSLLSDKTLNTASARPNKDRIGVMPNLRSLIQKHF